MQDADPIRQELMGNYDAAFEMKGDPTSPNLELALKIREDFGKYYSKASALMVHCWAGLSRSASTARALCDLYGIHPEWAPNEGRELMLNLGWLGNMWNYKLIRTGTD